MSSSWLTTHSYHIKHQGTINTLNRTWSFQVWHIHIVADEISFPGCIVLPLCMKPITNSHITLYFIKANWWRSQCGLGTLKFNILFMKYCRAELNAFYHYLWHLTYTNLSHCMNRVVVKFIKIFRCQHPKAITNI